MSGADNAQLFATYSGTWILDVSSSSPQIPNALEGVEDNQQVEDLASRPGGLREQRYWRRLAARQRDIGALRETIEVLRERPETLTLQLDATTFAYRPTPGTAMELPMDGTDIDRSEGEYPVDAKLEWDEQFPVIVKAKNANLLCRQSQDGWKLVAQDPNADKDLWEQPLPDEPVRWAVAVG